jgi:hypothetical protein
MGCLDRDGLLQCKNLPVERVEIPERGAYVCVRVMTGAERDHFEILMQRAQRDHDGFFPNIRATLAVFTLCDEMGGRLFTTEEIDAVGELDSMLLDRVFDVARRMNRMTREEGADLTKNSVTTPDASSGSALPAS